MTESIPRNVLLFESLSIMSVALGAIHAGMVPGGLSISSLFQAALILGLTIQVSRYRKNWARWFLTGLFLFGVLFMILVRLFVPELPTVGYPMVTFAIAVMQGAGVILLFTRQANDWLRRRPAVTETSG